MVNTPSTHPELVVGIGASAGGLRALETLFQAMPCDTGCAFVVVQHLSPDFKSLMNDLLARHTRMHIHRVEDGMALERDCVYLIPPRKLMTVKGGKLFLTEREATRQLEFPINVFFESLASDFGPQAVSVVLSGTGTDGSQGIRAVHECGGLVVVQAPDSADFNGMPRSAANTGLADYILPPERMPEAVITYARYPQLRMVQNARPMSANEASSSFGPVLDRLRQANGIDFGEYKIPTVQRRIHRRMSFLQLADVNAYSRLLGEQPAELDELYRDLLIGVTEFFRDPDSFEALGREALGTLLAESGREELRVWTAGCATGEEAYSLGILVSEAVAATGFKGKVSIFATDMHKGSLARASAGVYERSQLENLGEERIKRFFREEASGYMRVVPELRQRILFSAHNVVSDPPFTKIDLLVCRNVLIYFQPATQERVISLFHFAMRKGGFLFLGSSEGLGSAEGAFTTVVGRSKIYRKTTDSVINPPEIRSLPPVRILRAAGASMTGSLPSTITVTRSLLQAYDFLLKQTVPASLIVTENGEIVQFFEQSSRYLLPPEGRSHDNIYNRTEGDLRLALSTIIPKAIKSGSPAQALGIKSRTETGPIVLDVRVQPIPDDRNGVSLLHVLFTSREAPHTNGTAEKAVNHDVFHTEDALGSRIKDLELELHSTKENLQATVEELQTSNEELQATNEELLAANEELQSTNEELHSVNEELYTVNAEFERKNHELKTVGEDLNNLLSSTDIGTLFLDRNLKIRRFTPAIARIFHLLPQDISRPIDHLAYQFEGDFDLLQSLRQVVSNGIPVERELKTRSGEWLLQRVLPFRTAEEQIDGAVLTFTDITAVKEIQDKFNLAMDFSRMVWWEWDLQNQRINIHTGGHNTLGYPTSMVTLGSAEWQGLVHREDQDRVKRSLDACLGDEIPRWESQHRHKTRDGHWSWVVCKGQVSQRTTTGTPLRMLGTLQDVNERCLAEQELRKLNAALDRSPLMVMITDLEGRIEYVNQHFCEVTGYAASEVMGQNPRILKSLSEAEDKYGDIWAALKRGETWQGELINCRKDGREFRERATIAPLRDADGACRHYVAMKEEVRKVQTADDEQRRMEEQLSQIQKMETLGALAGGIAHDFNNILTAIVGHTELALELAPKPHPVYESMMHVKKASERASDLVRKILSFSHRGPSHREKIDLASLVTDVMALLRASIPSSIKLEISLATTDLLVMANPTDIQQVILNLGGNAAYAMRQQGGILGIGLEVRQIDAPLRATAGTLGPGCYLCLKVSDTGSGIPPHVLGRMFEPFFTTKASGEGTGLGLSIVLGVVLAHGGAIVVTTEPARGTTFEILLPAVQGSPVAAHEEDPVKPTGSGQKIAFIDDEASITLMAERGLQMRGYAPSIFPDALNFLQHLSTGATFDLIVTDHTMPGMTGLELIKRIRGMGNGTPIIILSGNNRYVTPAELANLGNVQFMPKPFDLSALQERIWVGLNMA